MPSSEIRCLLTPTARPHKVTAGREIHLVFSIFRLCVLCLRRPLSHLILITLSDAWTWAPTWDGRNLLCCFSDSPGQFSDLPLGLHVWPQANWACQALSEVRCLGLWYHISLSFSRPLPANPTAGKGLYFYLLDFPPFQVVFQTNTCGHCSVKPKYTNFMCRRVFWVFTRDLIHYSFLRQQPEAQGPLPKPLSPLSWQE